MKNYLLLCAITASQGLDEKLRRMADETGSLDAMVYGTVYYSKIISSEASDLFELTDAGKQLSINSLFQTNRYYGMILRDFKYEVIEKDNKDRFFKEYYLSRFIADTNRVRRALRDSSEESYSGEEAECTENAYGGKEAKSDIKDEIVDSDTDSFFITASSEDEFEETNYIKVVNHTPVGDFEYNYSDDTILNNELAEGDMVGVRLGLIERFGRKALEMTEVHIYHTTKRIITKKEKDAEVIAAVKSNNEKISELLQQNYDLLYEQGLISGRFSVEENKMSLENEANQTKQDDSRIKIPDQIVKARVTYDEFLRIDDICGDGEEINESEHKSVYEKLIKRLQFKDAYRFMLENFNYPEEVAGEFRRQYVAECASIMEATLRECLVSVSAVCKSCAKNIADNMKPECCGSYFISRKYMNKEYSFVGAIEKLKSKNVLHMTEEEYEEIIGIYQERNKIHISNRDETAGELDDEYIKKCVRVFDRYFYCLNQYLMPKKGECLRTMNQPEEELAKYAYGFAIKEKFYE